MDWRAEILDGKMEKDFVKGALLVLGALYLFGMIGPQQGTGGTTTTTPITTITPTGCNYAPTVALTATDKFDASISDFGTWKYKLNGGATATDSDGSFEVGKGSSLSVLVADSNSSGYYKAIWNPPLDCGVNSLGYTKLIPHTTYETKCFDENKDPINGTTYVARYLTIGTEGTRSVACELTGVAKKGMPYGGIMILEFNQSTYNEGELEVTWDGAVASATGVPGAYSVGTAGSMAKAFSIPAFEGSMPHKFYINLQADANINPGESNATATAYGDAVLGRIYPINCFEEEDKNPSTFECAIEDMDNTFTAPGGTTKDTADITSFGINVD